MEDKTVSVKGVMLYILKWLCLGAVIGVLCSGAGVLFASLIAKVTNARSNNFWLIYLLPLGGMLSVWIYRLLRVEGVSTEQVIETVQGRKRVPIKIFPAIFFATIISHTFGASAGKEGAALQLGGGLAALVSRFLKLDNNDYRILTTCTMGAFFSALFGTPFAACFFALEVAVMGKIYLSALLPSLVSCSVAAFLSQLLGGHAEHYTITNIPHLSLSSVLSVVLLSVIGLAVSFLFCKFLAACEVYLPRLIKNSYLRIVLGSAVVIVLTLLLGNTDYNGAGTHVIERIMTGGEVNNFAFVLKALFTVVSVSCGFKGGEIVPTLFIGASLGCVIAPFLGLPAVFGAAVGMISLFCGATKCPLASFFLSVEMFGGKGILFFAICVLFSYLPIEKTGLYTSQKFVLKNRA